MEELWASCSGFARAVLVEAALEQGPIEDRIRALLDVWIAHGSDVDYCVLTMLSFEGPWAIDRMSRLLNIALDDKELGAAYEAMKFLEDHAAGPTNEQRWRYHQLRAAERTSP
jgi:hypothetical protein